MGFEFELGTHPTKVSAAASAVASLASASLGRGDMKRLGIWHGR